MNYRAIFNPNYNFIGIILLILIITILFLLNKNLKYTLTLINKTFFITGIIALSLSVFINIILRMFIPYHYRIFIQVISDNVIKNSTYYSCICIVLGLIGTIFIKILPKGSKVH